MGPVIDLHRLPRFMCDALHACSCSELGPVASQMRLSLGLIILTLSSIRLDYTDLSGLPCQALDNGHDALSSRVCHL